MMAKVQTLALLTGLLAVLPQTVLAEEAAGADSPKIVVGATTKALLDMQREGKSPGASQPIGGEEASRAYGRYLKSYEKAMPEFNASVGSGGQTGSGN